MGRAVVGPLILCLTAVFSGCHSGGEPSIRTAKPPGTPAQGREIVLYNFSASGADGAHPFASLIQDNAGNLYGTTEFGGASDHGTVFELTPSSPGGPYIETVLYSFGGCPTTGCGPGSDGANPYAGLVSDSAGNLYGTTISGGVHGGGTVFELTPSPGAAYTETLLHSFAGCPNAGCGIGADGASPYSGLILDSAGNLYGTTSGGGTSTKCASACGTVFELTPSSPGGPYVETVLYSFTGCPNTGCGPGSDGMDPRAGLILDKAGNLYGTTESGGASGGGTVFRLTPSSPGEPYTETVLHSFAGCPSTGCGPGSDGAGPSGDLAQDSAGDLYGTTYLGGSNNCILPGSTTAGCGTVFELMPPVLKGPYAERLLYSFGATNSDGYYPVAGVTLGSADQLYGTTVFGAGGSGTVFELTPSSPGGTYTEEVLHYFAEPIPDGTNPYAGLLLNSAGNLYGVTSSSLGAISSNGAVFEVIP